MLSVLIGFSGAAYVAAATAGARVLVYVLKPATMLLILMLAAGGLGRTPAPAYGWAVLVGLALSLVGDICLMLRQERLWLIGAGAFLLAHLVYIAGFWWGGLVRLTWLDGVTGAVMAVAGVLFVRALARGLERRGQMRLLGPLAAYAAVLSVMAWLAVGVALGGAGAGAVGAGSPEGGLALVRAPLVAAGGLLFYLSDSLLAYDRFVRPLPWRDLLVMGPYFAAQYLLALSVAWVPG